MKLKLVGVWAVLLLLPVIPVVIFYAVFRDQNYFELKNAARGIVATGPIAAYVGLVLIGWSIYKRLSSLIFPIGPDEERFVGTSWDFSAISSHNTQRKGSFSFSIGGRGELNAAGNFQDSETGQEVGQWESTMARCKERQLEVLYDLDDMGKGALEKSTGVLSLSVDPRNPKRMSGTWVVLGKGEAFGTITCTRQT